MVDQPLLGKSTYCLPEGVIADQLKDIVVIHLQNNPSRRHKPAVLEVMLAWSEAFPCSKQNNSLENELQKPKILK